MFKSDRRLLAFYVNAVRYAKTQEQINNIVACAAHANAVSYGDYYYLLGVVTDRSRHD